MLQKDNGLVKVQWLNGYRSLNGKKKELRASSAQENVRNTMLQESDQVAQACKQNYTGYIEFKQANDTASAHIHS